MLENPVGMEVVKLRKPQVQRAIPNRQLNFSATPRQHFVEVVSIHQNGAALPRRYCFGNATVGAPAEIAEDRDAERNFTRRTGLRTVSACRQVDSTEIERLRHGRLLVESRFCSLQHNKAFQDFVCTRCQGQRLPCLPKACAAVGFSAYLSR